MNSTANQLRQLLSHPELLVVPGCHDALSAQLCAQAGFSSAFMSGFAVSAARLAVPDTGLISYAELLDQGRNICNAVSIPIWGDGDTGFGNALNIKRTVQGYAQAGFACIMIEDQVAPKRCGHTRGKKVVSREEAFIRIQAAVDARDEGADILIMARTDARATDDIEEAIFRANSFHEIGADINFLEAPESVEEMQKYCNAVPGHKLANLIEQGKTPILSHQELFSMGYKIAVYPLTLLNVSIKAMQASLSALQQGKKPTALLDFNQLTEAVGFNEYYENEKRYAGTSDELESP
jgi:2-methylisocitrate lyase-like PEP mutase family enzyme